MEEPPIREVQIPHRGSLGRDDLVMNPPPPRRMLLTHSINRARRRFIDWVEDYGELDQSLIFCVGVNDDPGGSKDACIVQGLDNIMHFSPEEQSLSSVLDQMRLDPKRTQLVSITHDFQLMMRQKPDGMEILLEEIVEIFPNLRHIWIIMREYIHDDELSAQFVAMLSRQILIPFVGRNLFELELEQGIDDERDECSIIAQSIDSVVNGGFASFRITIEDPSQREDSLLLLQLSYQLVQHPKMRQFKGAQCPLEWMIAICSKSTLRTLDLADTNPWNWRAAAERGLGVNIPLLVAALAGGSNNSRRKRKRLLQDHQTIIGGRGHHHYFQLETLVLRYPDLLADATSSLCQAMKQNTTVRTFVIQGLGMSVKVINGQPVLRNAWLRREEPPATQAGKWEQFLEILRHNKTLETLDVTFYIRGRIIKEDTILTLEEKYTRYLQEELLTILTESNHTISSLNFGPIYRYGSTTENSRYGGDGAYCNDEWIHPRNIQYRLDLNYYQLSRFAVVAAKKKNDSPPPQIMEGFPKALISAVEKEEEEIITDDEEEEDTNNEDDSTYDDDSTDNKERHRLLSCLFQIWVDNPLLLINTITQAKTYWQ